MPGGGEAPCPFIRALSIFSVNYARYTVKILQYYVHISNTQRENSRFQRKSESRKNASKEHESIRGILDSKDNDTPTHTRARSVTAVLR